ncbi:MAG: hypothetical protein KAH22_06670 [Thiotrichaceae bacterium]|nr:hypothetical protein [Thiotrichaceae bacterium]
MARALNFTLNQQQFNFEIQKVDRSKIYGYTAIDVKDEKGSSCNLASISDDGLHVLSKGCVGYTTMTQDNRHIATNQLKMTDLEGVPLEKKPSSFDTAIALEPATLQEFLTLNVKSVYQLDYVADESNEEADLISQLDKHKVLKFLFNYRADYAQDNAFIIKNSDAVFMLVGNLSPFEFIGLEQQAVEIDDVEDDDDDFDFGML